ncbi:MAG: class I SAM-dependent methyltransferase [Candidatus Omnitrophica bacterium]|nr:class I SAM-dependent methyltransferase [Candidatus Omnitrophota bacterium]
MSAVSFIKRILTQAVHNTTDRIANFGVNLAAHHLGKRIEDRVVIHKFNKIYYDFELFEKMGWLGVKTGQNPCDNWVMQEIITEVKPDFIIETGTGEGGTTLFYATVLSQVNELGKILTIDLVPQFGKASKFKLFQERVEFIQGSTTSPKIVEAVTQRVKGKKVLITLDSKHTKENVLNEIKCYAPLVSRDSYLVVQDTNANGHPVLPDFGPGPYEAVQEFLKTDKNFVIDHNREKFLLTFYPSGYLKRIK